ncbi:MAG TPA: tetratricopeptide repeat protein [Polyangiaceae bacterium]
MATPRFLFPTVAVAAIGLLAPSVARADPVSDAKDLFTRGRDLRTHGDCAGAVPLFRKAADLYPAGLGSVRNLAECEEQLGHYASARRAWLDLKRALLTTDDKKYEGWSQDAEAAATRLAPKLATLTVDVSYATPDGQAALAKGVTVTLDNETLPPALVGTPLERDPGHHVVRVAGDRVDQPQQKAVDLVAGDNKHVALRVVVKPPPSTLTDAATRAGDGVPPPEHPAPADDDEERARSTKRMVAWIAIGVGGASLIGAGVSLAVRQSALSDAQNICGTGDLSNCPRNNSTLDSDVSRGQTASTMVTVLSIVGAVGLTSGIVLLATSFGHSQQSRLIITPTLGGATAAWRF